MPRRLRPGRVRIIGGHWRGRLLDIAGVDGLRPTGDRIRETLFNWLAPHIHGARCLDLFAGTGALGFEAASRGAAAVDLVELSPRAVRQLEANREALIDGDQQIHIHCMDALSFLARTTELYDVVFVDPPFAMQAWEPVLDALPARLLPRALVYLESPAKYSPALGPTSVLAEHKSGQAGAVAYRLLTRT